MLKNNDATADPSEQYTAMDHPLRESKKMHLVWS